MATVRRLPCNHEQHHEWVDSRKERDENSHDISSLSETKSSDGKKTNCREWDETDEEGNCELKMNGIVIDAFDRYLHYESSEKLHLKVFRSRGHWAEKYIKKFRSPGILFFQNPVWICYSHCESIILLIFMEQKVLIARVEKAAIEEFRTALIEFQLTPPPCDERCCRREGYAALSLW